MDVNMAKKKSSPEDWVAARLRWETEPSCTYSDLVEFLGVSKQAIAKRAHKDGWAKQLDMARVVEMAHQKADRQSTAANAENARPLSPQAPVVVHPGATKSDLDAPPESRHEADQAAAVTARAAILERHRTEWVAARNMLYASIKGKDFELSRTVKNVVDAMKKIQEGERDAWDLAAVGNVKPTLQIIVERSADVRVVR
jgi:hypothetical protein